MNRMKKQLALLLVLAMVLSLAACGSAKSDIIGTWQGRIDMTEAVASESIDEGVKELLASMDYEMELSSVSDYVSSFDPLCVYVFNEDGSYAITMDETSLRDELEEYKAGLTEYFRQFFFELLSQTLVELNLAEQVSSEEALEALMGVSLDEAISEAVGMELRDFVSQIVDEEMGTAGEIAAEFKSEGKYKAKDGKLWLSAGLEYNVDPEMYEHYSISGSTLTIEEGTVSQDEEFARLYPLVFEKTA